MKKILIVDDEMDMRIFMSALFKTSGYLPIVKKNGEEGLRQVKADPPDLIILDVMMPRQGGVHMYRELRTDPKLRNIPVIMLSGVEKKSFYHYFKMLNIRLEEAVAEPDAYLEKPPEPEELLQTAELLLDK